VSIEKQSVRTRIERERENEKNAKSIGEGARLHVENQFGTCSPDKRIAGHDHGSRTGSRQLRLWTRSQTNELTSRMNVGSRTIQLIRCGTRMSKRRAPRAVYRNGTSELNKKERQTILRVPCKENVDNEAVNVNEDDDDNDDD
jgi:hypothetical protein